ncbi:MAG: DUF190 domain-containing protein [Solirubrobacteraceae bacterium]|nr:DUF190 domain-containing protein [Solirubrobacteraceae bacterium]
MTREALQLTVYAGERDRAAGRFAADAIADVFAARRLQTSIVLRGALGFGLGSVLRTDRLLTASEDLPVVSVAVDEPPRIEAALDDLRRLDLDGLVTLERARLLDPCDLAPARARSLEPGEATKLTVYVGRARRIAGRPAYEALVQALHDAGVAGASVLVGVDGTLLGRRRRARFFAANVDVPAMVVAVGERPAISAALPMIGALVENPMATLERVRVCKRDGRLLAQPHDLPDRDAAGLAVWQKLMVYASEQARHDGRPLHEQLVRRLRERSAPGATCLRGVWGYHGAHRPHGDGFWQLRRRVPTLTIVVDEPDRAQRWFEVIDELTDETGLVTSEMVPALRATRRGTRSRGGLRLAGHETG